MSKNKKELKKLDDECIDKVSGGSWYKEDKLWKPYVIYDNDFNEHRAWTEKGAKELDVKLNGEERKLKDYEYYHKKCCKAIMKNKSNELFYDEDHDQKTKNVKRR